MSYVVNKRTNRRIKIGSPTYKRALANGDVSPRARKFRTRSRSTSRSRSRSVSRSRSRSRSRSPKTLPREVAGTCKTGTHFYKQNQVGKRSPIARDKVKTPSRTKRCSAKKLSKSTTRVTRRSRTPVKRTRSPVKRTRSPVRRSVTKRAKSPVKRASSVRRTKSPKQKQIKRAKSVQKTLEELMNLPEPGVIIEDGNMIPIEEEFAPTIPMEEMAMASVPGSSKRGRKSKGSMKRSLTPAQIEAKMMQEMVGEIPKPKISENCPPAGTQGTVMEVEGGYIFVYNDGDTDKGLIMKQTSDKKLEVFSENAAYNRGYKITNKLFRNKDSSCTLFIQYLDNNNAVLVTNAEAQSYPDIYYPEPAQGWASWTASTIKSAAKWSVKYGIILTLATTAVYSYYMYGDMSAFPAFLEKATEFGMTIPGVKNVIEYVINKLVAQGVIAPQAAPTLWENISNNLPVESVRNFGVASKDIITDLGNKFKAR